MTINVAGAPRLNPRATNAGYLAPAATVIRESRATPGLDGADDAPEPSGTSTRLSIRGPQRSLTNAETREDHYQPILGA